MSSFARSCVKPARRPKPYCNCKVTTPQPWKSLSACTCGEEYEVHEWKWQKPSTPTTWVIMCQDQKQVTFHPYFSSGTASVKGDTPMTLNNHYYWEVKMLTETYGTDIMVGMCSDKVSFDNTHFQFSSLLGQDKESYGLSYTGAVRHNSLVSVDYPGFCRGSIIGVRLDMWSGTMEFYINRKSKGITFYNLRRHKALYPILCSTAAQSCLKLIFASSWQASLQMEALKILNSSIKNMDEMDLPPGLKRTLKPLFWAGRSSDARILSLIPRSSGTDCANTAPFGHQPRRVWDHTRRCQEWPASERPFWREYRVYLKSRVYVNKPETLEALKDNIRHECEKLSPEVLTEVMKNAIKRARIAINCVGAHFADIIFST